MKLGLDASGDERGSTAACFNQRTQRKIMALHFIIHKLDTRHVHVCTSSLTRPL